MCFISLGRKKVRLFIDVLFACLPLLDQELSPFFYNGGRPLVSILKGVIFQRARKIQVFNFYPKFMYPFYTIDGLFHRA